MKASRMLSIMKDAGLLFANRLAEICSDHNFKAHGRQAALVRVLKDRGVTVTQPAVKKWFDGEAIPDAEKCIEIASWAKICYEWLMTGRGPKHINELYPTRAIAHVAEVMQAMEANQQYKISQMVDLLAQPAPANDPQGPDNSKPSANSSQ
jgi:hypothetical protein